MSEYHSSIDTKVQQLIDEDLRRALFQHATEAMAVNIDEENGFAIKDTIEKIDGKKILWETVDSACLLYTSILSLKKRHLLTSKRRLI